MRVTTAAWAAAATAWFAIAATGAEPAKVPGKGPILHEWGVFCVYPDVEAANVAMRAEWDALPKFVYGRLDGRRLPYRGAVLKPVIWLRSAEAVDFDLKVAFSSGQPAVWWPATMEPAGGGRVPPPTDKGQYLRWQGCLKQPKNGGRGGGLAPVLQPVPEGHWMAGLRKVAADDVFVWNEHSQIQQPGFQVEKFLYYDGIMPPTECVKVTANGGKVSLRNRAKHAVEDVWVVDRRTAGKLLIGNAARLDAGAEEAVEPALVDAARGAGEAEGRLVAQLVKTGLEEDEAKALAECWRKELFGADGLTVFYRLPQEEYDRMLPLTLKPAAEKTVRVGLVLHAHCEPDLAAKVAALVKEFGSENFKIREQADERLAALMPAAFSHVTKAAATATDPETKSRLERLLEKYDAARALKK